MNDDEAHLEIIKSEEIKKLSEYIYKRKIDEKLEVSLKDNLIQNEEAPHLDQIDLVSDDLGVDEIARVRVNSETMNDIDIYMKEHDLANFSEAVNTLIKLGLQTEEEE